MRILAGALVRHDFATGMSRPIATTGYGEESRKRVGDAARARNPLLAREGLFRAPGSVWLDHDLLPRQLFAQTPFFRAWMQPRRFASWGCVIVQREGQELVYLEFLSSDGKGLFPAQSLARLRPLVPHLRRILNFLPQLDRPQQEQPQAQLRTRYSLTRAEARLADLLTRGLSLSAAADRLCVSYHTVKTHLHRIYGKTGTSRQAELIALLLSTAALSRADAPRLPAASATAPTNASGCRIAA